MDSKSYTIRVPKRWVRIAIIVGVTTLIVAPLTAVATHSFTDVPNDNTFHEDIAWLKDADVTRGCNPPTNSLYCPDDNVTREQMAAFMRRLAENQVVDAGAVGGLDVSGLILAGPGLATASDDTVTSTASTTYVDIPSMSKQVVVPPGENRDALIAFSAVVDCNQNPVVSAWCLVRVQVDGVTVWDGQFSGVQHGPNSTDTLGEGAHSLQAVAADLAPGPHTVTVQYRVDESNSLHQLRDKYLSVMTFPASTTDVSATVSGSAADDEK